MPCGTGKTLTAYWLADKLKAKNIIVAVPSLYRPDIISSIPPL
jgi:predicted helicase